MTLDRKYHRKSSNNLLLSIVIPLFNVERYVNQLLISLSKMRLTDCEIIFVDDGSSDNSSKIVSKWLSEHANQVGHVHTFKQNRGLSEARNYGTHRAKGQYIWYIDSDDIVDFENFPPLMSLIRQNKYDLILFDFSYFNQANIQKSLYFTNHDIRISRHFNTHLSDKRSLPSEQKLQITDSVIRSFMADQKMYVWAFVVRRQKLKGLNFKSNSKFEDISFTPRLLLLCDSFYYLHKSMIFYRQHQSSITQNRNLQSCVDLMMAMNENYSEFDQCIDKLSEGDILSWFAFHFKTLIWGVKDIFQAGFINQPSAVKSIYEARALFFKRSGVGFGELFKFSIGRSSKFELILSFGLYWSPLLTVSLLRLVHGARLIGRNFTRLFVATR